ncbi:hypothetical protein [Acidithiobacillus sp.]|uniref:hypothetical protein n=1 Tax=Acidithiobacillus sp. TaxID=1872118 RepID=UPI0025BFD612|nr:hypothetical protein [Acidithiobacillus sp.]
MHAKKESRPARGAAGNTRPYSSPIDATLSRLEGVKRTGPGKWIARCPSHDDRHPSLSIKEADDGLVLIHCWTGCAAADVVAALGLSLADLFPGDRRTLADHSNGPMRRPFDYRDALFGVAHEVVVVRLIVESVRAGHPLSDEDAERLALAQERISDAARIAGGVL